MSDLPGSPDGGDSPTPPPPDTSPDRDEGPDDAFDQARADELEARELPEESRLDGRWDEGSVVEIPHESFDDPRLDDSSPDARTEADAARAAVAKAYETGTPNTQESMNAEIAAFEALPVESDDGVKQVEFQEPGPAKEVEFQEPAGPVEAEVVTEAKEELHRLEGEGVVLGGDPVGRAELWHEQGDNDRGFQQDCALATTSAVLRDCGVEASESDVVDQAVADGLCDTSNEDPAANGGVDGGDEICQLLGRNGVDSSVVHPESPEELAEWVDQGHGVIAEVNSGELRGSDSPEDHSYDSQGRARVDHAVQVTGTTRDMSGQLTGFVVNDTGSADGAARVVTLETWGACWTDTDRSHETVVTTLPTRAERTGR